MSRDWAKNLTKIPPGKFRTVNGIADEFIAIGKTIKAGFPCSKSDITNGRYDAMVEVRGKLLKVQIKATSGSSLSFIGGVRAGRQIDKTKSKSGQYKYTKKDCDFLLGVNSNNGDCYIIPIKDLKKWGKSKSLNLLEKEGYKENWNLFKKR